MFTNRITYKYVTTKIEVKGWNRFDATFGAIAEVLLSNRIAKDETFQLKTDYDSNNTLDLATFTDYNFLITTPRNIREFNDAPGTVDLGYMHDIELEKFIKKNHGIKVYVLKNITMCRSIVILFKKTIEAWHLIGSYFPKLCPWFFENNPLTDDEIEFLAAFQGDDYNFVKNYLKDFRDLHQVDLLEGLAARLRDEQAKAIKSDIVRINDKIQYNSGLISELIQKRQSLHIKLKGLMTNDDEDPAKLFREYLKANTNIKMTALRDTTATFEIYTKLTNVSKEAAEYIIQGNDSTFSSVVMNMDKWRRFFRRAFIAKDFKINICACYYIDLMNFRYGADRMTEWPEDYIPNPHIQDFRCIGDYYSMLTTAQNSGDITGLLMIMNASAGSVNLNEYPSARNLFGYISRAKDKKICTDKFNRSLTPEEIGSMSDEEWETFIKTNPEENVNEVVEEVENAEG